MIRQLSFQHDTNNLSFTKQLTLVYITEIFEPTLSHFSLSSVMSPTY